MNNLPVKTIHVSNTDTPVDQEMSQDAAAAYYRAKGLEGIGYHYMVTQGGTMVVGLEEGAVAEKGDTGTVYVVYVGGADKDGKAKDTRTDNQKAALANLTDSLMIRHPDAKVVGMPVDAPVAAAKFVPIPSFPAPIKDATDGSA